MKILFLLTSCFLIYNLAAEPEWKKRKEKSGITIYTRTVENAPMDEFRGELTLSNTSLIKVLDVITDIENYPNWIPDCMKAEILVNEKKYNTIHYITIKAPWPVTDRDVIYEMTTKLNSDNTFARIDLHPRGNYIDEKEKFVRLYKGKGFWELEANHASRVKVTYQFLGDPGGKVPPRLANSYVISNPFKTLSNLRDIFGK